MSKNECQQNLRAPLLSLVLCTVGRSIELKKFLTSILPGSIDVELIIVDQNETDEVIGHLTENLNHKFRTVKWIRVDKISLSYARNIGLDYCTGEFIGFPDDDCEYVFNLLESVVNKLCEIRSRNGADGVQGVAVRFPGCKPSLSESKIYWKDLAGRVISFSFFISKNVVDDKKIRFNENLGVGCYFGAGEETDFLVRCLGLNQYLLFIDDLFVLHPENKYTSVTREFQYGKGFGALSLLYLKYFGIFALPFFIKIHFGPAIKMIIYGVKLNFSPFPYLIHNLAGRFIGAVNWLFNRRMKLNINTKKNIWIKNL
jgi:glycosyltransferase involved in cell wall biosynthesis